MQLTHLLFDLDNTLYPPTSGVLERVDTQITLFLVELLGVSRDEAEAIRARYRDAHGTTLHGLMLHHQVAPDSYLTRVHDAVAIDDLLAPDEALQAMLQALPQHKIVFTNGPSSHAERVLTRLGVRECFADVFCLERLAYVPKPQPAAFETVLGELGVSAPRCLAIDDRLDNLCTARTLGMRTMLVGTAPPPGGARIDFARRRPARGFAERGQDPRDAHYDYVVDSVLDLPRVLEEAGAL